MAGSVYSVLPRHRQLRIQYCFGRYFSLVVIAGAIAILILYLADVYISTVNPVFKFFCEDRCLPAVLWIETAQVTIASMITGTVLYRLWRSQPVIRRDDGLTSVLRSLFTSRDYDTFVSVILENYDALIRRTSKNNVPSSVATAERILLDNHFTEQYGDLNPDFGIKLIGDENAEIPKSEFTKAFLIGLHNDETSILYHEIENNRYGESRRYRIEPENRLLHALFSDCIVAYEVSAWKGIGDNTQDILDELSRKEQDPYIQRDSKFTILSDDDDVFRDQLFVAVRFFDIMVTEALCQDIDHHMWIGYFDGFTMKICRNYEIGTHGDPTAEFPNDYSYILKEMFDVLTKQIKFVYEDPDEVYLSVQNLDTTHEADIVKTAIRNLFICHKHILLTDEIPDQFKQYISDNLFEVYFDLVECQTDVCDQYETVMYQHFVSDYPMNPIAGANHRQYLQKVLNNLHGYDTATLITTSHGGNAYGDLIADIQNQIAQK